MAHPSRRPGSLPGERSPQSPLAFHVICVDLMARILVLMSVNIVVDSSRLTQGAAVAMRNDAEVSFAMVEGLRQLKGIPESQISLLFTDDLVGAVRKHARYGEDAGALFSADRIGGVVAAKNLPQTEDYSEVLIVFDTRWWSNEPANGGAARLEQLFLLAHELCHPLMERARYCSGALDGVIFPSFTGNEAARSLSRILADEYRADRIADSYLRQLANTNIHGEVRPVGMGEVLGASYLEAAFASVAQAHPLWPDFVQNYREWGSDLSTMWAVLVGNME